MFVTQLALFQIFHLSYLIDLDLSLIAAKVIAGWNQLRPCEGRQRGLFRCRLIV